VVNSASNSITSYAIDGATGALSVFSSSSTGEEPTGITTTSGAPALGLSRVFPQLGRLGF